MKKSPRQITSVFTDEAKFFTNPEKNRRFLKGEGELNLVPYEFGSSLDFSMERESFQKSHDIIKKDLTDLYRKSFDVSLLRAGYKFDTDQELEKFLSEKVLEVKVVGSESSSYYIMPEQEYLFTMERKTKYDFSGKSIKANTEYEVIFNNPPKVNLDTMTFNNILDNNS